MSVVLTRYYLVHMAQGWHMSLQSEGKLFMSLRSGSSSPGFRVTVNTIHCDNKAVGMPCPWCACVELYVGVCVCMCACVGCTCAHGPVEEADNLTLDVIP